MAMRRFGWFAGTECSGFGDLDSEESENLREISSRSGGNIFQQPMPTALCAIMFTCSSRPRLSPSFTSVREHSRIAAAAALINNPLSSLFIYLVALPTGFQQIFRSRLAAVAE